MHEFGCPMNNNSYADCRCAAILIRNQTEASERVAEQLKQNTAAMEEHSVVLKAFNGDRAKNLEAIVEEFIKLVTEFAPRTEQRRFLGYCEQLGIIADELGKD